MPLFEYVCNSCGRKFTSLVGVVAGSPAPACPKCGAVDLTKLVSRFSTTRSEDEVLDDLGDMAESGDRASMHRLMREMKGELGEDLGHDLDEMLDSEGDDEGEEDLM